MGGSFSDGAASGGAALFGRVTLEGLAANDGGKKVYYITLCFGRFRLNSDETSQSYQHPQHQR